ncbi:hypothetical protein ACH427_27785 [Streptomyces sp. NPDC020379]|uniref:hypothetical protein n=1 Tax=Streptomyces sp. NPDC020379 TaxID=3365071 RepID=UPI0037986EAF
MLNARAFKSPCGDPIIVVNQGLPSLLSEFKEVQIEAVHLHDQADAATENAYRRAWYRFILAQFDGIHPFDNGMLETPGNLLQAKAAIRLPKPTIYFTYLDIIGAEMFVLAHELAHVSAGHLDAAQVHSVAPDGSAPSPDKESLTCYELSWQQEYEADRLGFLHFLKAWPHAPMHPPGFPITPPEIISPLSLFELLHLVESNLGSPDAYGTHPPAWRRAIEIIRIINEQCDLAAPENANLRALCASYGHHLETIQQFDIHGNDRRPKRKWRRWLNS